MPENAVIRVPPELDWSSAALLGCAVLTGIGAVRNTARVAAGRLGAGDRPRRRRAVGGRGRPGRRRRPGHRGGRLARRRRRWPRPPARPTSWSPRTRCPRTSARLTDGRGADHAFECVGRSATIRAAWRATRRGGQVTVVGMGGPTTWSRFARWTSSPRRARCGRRSTARPTRTWRSRRWPRDVLVRRADAGPPDHRPHHLADVPAAFDRMSPRRGRPLVVVIL